VSLRNIARAIRKDHVPLRCERSTASDRVGEQWVINDRSGRCRDTQSLLGYHACNEQQPDIAGDGEVADTLNMPLPS